MAKEGHHNIKNYYKPQELHESSVVTPTQSDMTSEEEDVADEIYYMSQNESKGKSMPNGSPS